MSRVIILTGDIIQKKIAGPAVRAVEIAKALSKWHEVTLACPEIKTSKDDFTYPIIEYNQELQADLVSHFDVAVAPGSLLIPRKLSCPLVVDLYDPYILSNLHRYMSVEAMDIRKYEADFEVLVEKLVSGDFFLCACARQRDFWLGFLTAFRRVNYISYSVDQNLTSLIDVVPFGIQKELPGKSESNPFPSHEPGDQWIIWGGGIWDWFDPVSLIKAIGAASVDIPGLKLYFMGAKHPDPRIPRMKRAVEAMETAKQLNLLDKHVFFGDWIPYQKRGNFLSHAAIGVSTHFPHIETRFSFRTRLLDYFWARLPVICTEGDSLADLVKSRKLGITVPPNDPDALTKAMKTLLLNEDFNRKCRENLNVVAQDLTWEKVIKPLRTFCDNPIRSSDKTVSLGLLGAKDEMFVGGCESRDIPAGEIFGNNRAEQLFVCRMNGLCRIDLKLGTYARENKGLAFVFLEDLKAKDIVVKFSINLSDVVDNEWLVFRYHPLTDSKGKTYRLVIESPNVKSGNAVTIWTDSQQGTGYYYSNQKRKGSLTFRLYCQTKPYENRLSSLWTRMFHRKFF